MRFYLSLALYSLLVGGLVFAIYHHRRGGIRRAELRPEIHVKPYIADYWMTSYTMNPRGEVSEKRHMVRRSDGATSTAITVLEGPGTTPHREISLLDGRRIYVNDSQAIRTTFYMKDQELIPGSVTQLRSGGWIASRTTEVLEVG